jgi:hypothetical protein
LGNNSNRANGPANAVLPYTAPVVPSAPLLPPPPLPPPWRIAHSNSTARRLRPGNSCTSSSSRVAAAESPKACAK